MISQKKCTAAALLSLAALTSSLALPAWADDTLPAGTLITGTSNGLASGLLGLDSLFANVPGSNITAVVAADLEYLSSDYTFAIDFLTDGAVLVYDNTGDGAVAGSYTLNFSFAGLGQTITGFTLSDVSQLIGGTITPLIMNDHSISLSFKDLSFSGPYASFNAQLSLAPAVPEPASVALLLAGLGVLCGARRRKPRA